jgi:hypothetical protein
VTLVALVVAHVFVMQTLSGAHAQAGQAPDTATLLAALPSTPYATDMATALGATSDAVRERQSAVVAARTNLARAIAGLEVVGLVAPALEFERDLTDPAAQGAWETDVDVSLDATYRRDTRAVLRARLALLNAQTQLRDQVRADLQRALLALSAARLDARSASQAEVAAEQARAALAEAETSGATEPELLQLRVAAELAANAVERAQVEAQAATAVAARLGLGDSAPLAGAPLSSAFVADGDHTLEGLSPASVVARLVTVPTPELHSEARALAVRLSLATAQANATAFTVLRELELYGAYENTGFEVESRVALVTGVPLVGAGVSWTNGETDVGFTVGIGATLRVSDATGREAAAAAEAVTEAHADYAAFLDAQVAAELAARRMADLEFEEFGLERLQWNLVESQLAAVEAEGAPQREVQRLTTALGRAQDATERAWQRYVRSLVNYLGVVDAMWRADVMEER